MIRKKMHPVDYKEQKIHLFFISGMYQDSIIFANIINKMLILT